MFYDELGYNVKQQKKQSHTPHTLKISCNIYSQDVLHVTLIFANN